MSVRQTDRSSDIDVEIKVFGWREQQTGRHRELILHLLVFIFSIQIVDVSAQLLHKYTIYVEEFRENLNLKYAESPYRRLIIPLCGYITMNSMFWLTVILQLDFGKINL